MQSTGNKKKVLFVDDDELIRSTTLDMINAMGYQAEVAGSGAEAIEIFKQQHEEISLIIIDFNMPDLDGLETSKALKEVNPNCVIVLSSGLLNDQDRLKMEQIGIEKALMKPYRLADMLQTIETLI